MSDDNKLSLTGRGKLGVGTSRDQANVRQNFSHGRSKPVVVERRRKRVLKKGTGSESAAGNEAKASPAAPEAPADPIAPVAKTEAPKPAVATPEAAKPRQAERTSAGYSARQSSASSAHQTVGRSVGRSTGSSGGQDSRSLTSQELAVRKRALESLDAERKRAEEEHQRVEAEARKRAEDERRRKAEEEAVREAAEAVRRAEAKTAPEGATPAAEPASPAGGELTKAEEQAKRLAEQAAKRAAEDKIRKKAEAEARKKTEEEERAREEAHKPESTKVDTKKPVKRREDKPEEDDEKRSRGKRSRGGDSRRSGKLTVNRAFDSEEEQERRRSMAAFRRAQAKRRGGQSIKDQEKQARDVIIPEVITVQELANRMAEKATDAIRVLMKMGVMATINENLDQDTAEIVVTELGHTPRRVSEADVEIGLVGEQDDPADQQPRPPVVTIMGHVDHGKTSLLDALRSTDVASGEAGGITQHIGAYQVNLPSGARITFLDTPGHEAFTQMRARGASVTDIVVLVVAADDGIKPQTIEAINHAKAAKVPMIIAINKIDTPGANPERVRQELLQHDVQVEAMGGDVLDVEVSALKRTNLDKLEDAIILQSEVLELKANPNRAAEGVVVEAKLEKGRGPVATVLVARGTLRVGDIVVAGGEWGKVRALIDERGQQLQEAGPARPVEILGLNGAPSAGDAFSVVESEARAREVCSYRQQQIRKRRQFVAPTSIEGMFTQLKEKKAEDFPVVIKGDVQGSVEAIVQSLAKIGGDDIKARVLHAAAGGITETDVTLANASGALIIGFNVRANKQAREAAERDGVAIKYYSVIYSLVDEVKAAMAGQLGPVIEETTIGMAEVRDVFSAGKSGKAAGCFVNEGVIRKSAKARLLRDDVVVYTGRLTSLRRFKDDVDEVRSGTECGMAFENYQDMKVGDQVEIFQTREVERKL
ncbi:translation initiation factor IF-2 [alpha proteobacterium Q-1]|nr:translation initiation factor IF-2 [alpha proteobacterium Q-1]